MCRYQNAVTNCFTCRRHISTRLTTPAEGQCNASKRRGFPPGRCPNPMYQRLPDRIEQAMCDLCMIEMDEALRVAYYEVYGFYPPAS